MSKKISFKAQLDLDQAIAYLEDIAKCLKDGKLCAQQGDDFITLSPDKDVFFELESSRKKDKESINIEIRWRKGGVIPQPEDFKISTSEPEIKMEETEGEAEESGELKISQNEGAA